MGEGERAVWQVSGGPANRSYGEAFVRHGVALIGPGDAGPWSVERDDSEFEGIFVRRFAVEPRVGDAIILRSGLSRIRAVGLVAGEYLHLETFDDVNGYDLQHARRIRWSALPEQYDFREPVFGANPPRFSRVLDARVRDYVRRYLNSPPTYWQEASLPPLPDEEPTLQEVPERLRGVVGEAQDLNRILSDLEGFGAHPSEDEMVAHLVIPFLRALGWPPERIAVKWRHVDVALFHVLPRHPEYCRLVIEAKRLGGGVEGALNQAIGYVRDLDAACDVLITDGIRYRIYAREKDFAPVAYANLARLKRSASGLFARLARP